MPKPARVVTRGDDSGSCHSANEAIKDAFQRGVLRNPSIMVPAPMFSEGAEMYKDLDGLCIGLHATLNDEWNTNRWGPVLGARKVPSLVMADGTFFKSPRTLWDNKPSNDEILAEIEAQLDVARSNGLNIKYLDAHMAFDGFDDLKPRLHAFAKEEGLIYGAGFLDRLPDVQGTFSDPVESLIAKLEATEAGKTYLLVTHPCYDRGDIRQMTYGNALPGEIATDRDWQRRALMDDRIVEYFKKNDVVAIRYTTPKKGTCDISDFGFCPMMTGV
ncbi:MAG: ChbG/HpnK family deacetylase [Candidatus Poribacteria bacterium]|nr:ChbG/HpnK family deacetylase [Candidatus Poribacteria bacterium]